MNILSFAAQTLRKQCGQVNAVHSQTGIGKAALWWTFWRYQILYGASPSDWLNYRMWEMSRHYARTFITARYGKRLDRLLNPRVVGDIYTNKVAFNRHFSQFVQREWIYTAESTPEEVREFALRIGRVVVKPIGLSSGRGVYGTEVDKDNVDELIAAVCVPGGDGYLLEEQIRLVDELERLNPPSCQTLRVYTVLTRGEEVRVIAAVIRVGGGNSVVDNFHAAGSAYPIDIGTGRISGPGIDAAGTRHLRTPSTNIFMPGYQIPGWDEVVGFCTKAHMSERRARFIGWDVAVTPTGLEMVEGNVRPNHNMIQIFDRQGRKKELYSYL